MSDVREWLEELGLGEYVELFVREKIALADLPHLTGDVLKELGLPTGPRLRILAAARDFASSSLNSKTEDAEPSRSAPSYSIPHEADRRQITVMFCDLVGSTALSETLDPEELRDIMQAYRKACGDVIERYDGHVAQYLGDGVMVYFGWPAAHEDDAQRAVQSGLDIVSAVAALQAEAALAVRIGIATGLVVVGESGADQDTDAKLAVGETPNIAARIQSLAEPGSIAIAQSTRRLLGGAFALDDLGSHDAKGVSGGLQVHRVVGATETESRFEASQGAAMTPLVGRESEISLLLDRWDQAKDGEGQVVLLSGEAGIGKSRVTQVLRERLADEPHTRLRYQCSPYYTNSAFYPVIGQLERAAGFAREDSSEARLDKLESLLAQGTEDVVTVAPLMAAMLSLPVDRYPPLNLSSQRQKDDTIAALATQVSALAARQPLLMLFEDAHWCDPTTLETLTAVIGQIEAAPVLLVITYRPELDPPWTGHGHVVAQSLGRLGKRQGADMVARVTGGKALPDEVLEQIVAKTDGIPLFVEELTKTVLEAGYLKDTGDRYELDGPLPPLAIPSTLQDSLMARLDRLSPVKEVAQTGACIGREFSHELLAAVSPLRDNELQDALQQLVNSELIFRRSSPPEVSYTFKHALVQDSAYESMLKSRRQQLHGTIARAMEESFPEACENQPELLARHFAGAGIMESAIRYWCVAGNRALAQSALNEAISHFSAGLTAVDQLADSVGRARLELDSRLGLAAGYMASLGWSTPQLGELYPPALDLAERLGDKDSLFDSLFGIWGYQVIRGKYDEGRETVEHMVRATLGDEDSSHAMIRNFAAGLQMFWTGQFEGVQDYVDRTRHHYSVAEHGGIALRLNNDPLTAILCWEVHRLWMMGHPDQSLAASTECVEVSRSLGHPFNLAFAISICMAPNIYGKKLGDSLTRMDEVKKIGDEQNMPLVRHCFFPIWRGHLNIAAGDHETGYEELRSGIEIWVAAGAITLLPFAKMMQAVALLKMQRPAAAREIIEEALAIAAEGGERMHVPEIYRVRGEIALHDETPDEADAERDFRRAIDEAMSMCAKSWELRAATSLARLWQSQGKEQEAHDILDPVYDWFTEGFDTTDLKDAKALLEELK